MQSKNIKELSHGSRIPSQIHLSSTLKHTVGITTYLEEKQSPINKETTLHDALTISFWP